MEAQEPISALRPLPRLLALHGMLRAHGKEVALQPLREASRGSDAASTLVGLLSDHGLFCRAVTVADSDLAHVSLPVMLMLTDERAWLLRGLDGRWARVQGQDGTLHRITRSELLSAWTGEIIEASSGVERERGLLGMVWASLPLVRSELARLGGVAALLTGLGLLGPTFVRIALDRAVPERGFGLLLLLAVSVALVSAQRAWLAYLRERFVQTIEARLLTLNMREVFRHALRVPLDSVSRKSVGELVQLLGQAGNVTGLLSRVAVVWLFDFLLASSYCVLVATELPGAALVLAGLGVLTLLIAFFTSRHVASLQQAELERSALQRGRLFQLISGIPSLKAAGAERWGVRRWLVALLEERTVGYRRERVLSALGFWLDAKQQVMLLAVIAWGASSALSGELSLGGYLACVMFADAFGQSLGRFAGGLPTLWAALPGVKQVDALLETDAEERHMSLLVNVPPVGETAIELNDVWFRYGPDQPWVLKGYSRRFNARELTTLAGASGKGKTTILRLIAGLYHPEQGSVRVFGRAPSLVRSAVAYLPQEAYLFEGTIMDNLRMLSGANRAEIERAAVVTGLAKWMATLPMKYDTPLPPGGRTLSGGQRQLVVLTAAVASNKPVLLLDEALAHMDRLTRDRLVRSPLFSQRTVLSVAHE